MSNQSLLDVVQSYLQAHHYLQECQSRGACDCTSEQRVQDARRELEKKVAEQGDAFAGEAYDQAAAGTDRAGPQSTILVALKDLDTDAPAVDTAGKYAQSMNAKVVLVNVIEPAYESSLETGCPTVDLLVYWRTNAAEMLSQAQFRLPVGVSSETLVREGGNAATVLLSEADRLGVDLIVLGERGGGRWAHFLSPGTALSVIRAATCPVMTVNRHLRSDLHQPALQARALTDAV